MDIKDRIVYSNEQMMASLEAALDRLNTFRYDGQYRQLLGDGFVDKLNDWVTNIRQRKDDPFTVVVVGDFKRGKSTLINALLGEEVVTTDVTTETVTLNRITYGAHSNEAVLSGGRRVRLTDGELKRDQLEQVLSGLDEPVARLELKRPCELLKKITIIDTPGTGDAMEDFSAMVKDSLLRADAVIYVYNIHYPLSHTEQLFLKSAVLPQQYTTLFLVGNFADMLETEQQFTRVREMLSERVKGLLPDAEILMVSALDELCRRLDKERPSQAMQGVLEGQFDRLRALLDELLAEKSERVVLDRMQRLTSAMVNDLSAELNSIDRGLVMSGEDAAAVLEQMRRTKEQSVQQQTQLLEDLDKQIESMRNEAILWMGELLEQIEKESEKLGGESSEDIRKYYEFYCIDLLQEGLTACLDYHQDQLYDQMDEISAELSEKLAGGMEQERVYQFRFHLDNRIWTRGDTVGLAVSMLSSTGLFGTVASLITDGISGGMREKEISVRTPELMTQIASKLTGLSVSVRETVEKLYSAMGDNAKKLIVEYYADELAAQEHLLDQTVKVSAKEEDEKAHIREAVLRARELLGKISVNDE